MTPHPRLYIRPAMLDRVRLPHSNDPRTSAAAAAVKAASRDYVSGPNFPWDPANGHNAHLIRARIMQTRIVTLLTAWLRSGEERFRKAVLEHVHAMAGWEYWSWITWRQGNPDPLAIFDLSYGENCATLAIAYDLLASTLTPAEKQLFLDQATSRALASFRRHTDPASPAWWLNAPNCNWQTVCAGGGGMLALALAEALPDLNPLIERADAAVTRYFQKVDEYGGGCVEGLAYWNYGMRYAFMFLLSHEAALGRPHPAFRFPGFRKTLRFPMDFTPQSVPCGFGDINHAWRPLPFHYAAAARFDDTAMARQLDMVLTPEAVTESAFSVWPNAAELLFLRPPPTPASPKPRRGPVHRLYPHMDWGVLNSGGDRPRLAATIRGGTTTGPHNHLDLFSFHLVCDGEPMVVSVSNSEYVDTTFSDRRFDIWEMRPDAKNVPFIGGVSLSHPASVTTTPIRIGPCRGFHLTGPDAIRIAYDTMTLVRKLDRLFLMLEDKAFLVIDRIELAAPNRIECRFHSPATVKTLANGACFTGRKARMRLTLAGTAPLLVTAASGAPNNPQAKPSTMLRVFSRNLEPALLTAAIFTPGASPTHAEWAAGPRGKPALRIRGRGFNLALTMPFTPARKPA